MTFPISLARCDGEVYEKGDGTLCDAYSKWHASYYVHFQTYLQILDLKSGVQLLYKTTSFGSQ